MANIYKRLKGFAYLRLSQQTELIKVQGLVELAAWLSFQGKKRLSLRCKFHKNQ